jgi:hypothetical protein
MVACLSALSGTDVKAEMAGSLGGPPIKQRKCLCHCPA